MIVTIDGPAGAGKSTAARTLARHLGFAFLDTGAMYRTVALAAERRGLDWNDARAIADLAGEIRIELVENRVFLDGEDVSTEVRSSHITALTRYAADNPDVRAKLVSLQREAAAGRDIVTEGRDQGTVAFPMAECKIFLTATPEERARRRLEQLHERGEDATFADVLSKQLERDARDAAREVGALKPASDAVTILTDGLPLDEVVARMEALVTARMPRETTSR